MSARPVSTPAEDRATVYAMASMLKASLPAGHPGHAKLDELMQRHAPLIIAKPAEAKAQLDDGAWTLGLAAMGSVLFTGAGYVYRGGSTSWGLTLFMIGALVLWIAFERSDAA